MKTGILIALGVVLVASGLSIRADDTADQAAARAALEQKFYQLDHPATQPTPDTNSMAVVAPSAESTTNVTNTVSATVAPAAKVQAPVAADKATPAPTASADADFTPKIPAADASAQAAALTALEQKMDELNHSTGQLPLDTNFTATVATSSMMAPAHEPSAAATPVTEAPTAEAPMAVTPALAPAAVSPVSAAPAGIAPVPKVSTATSVAVVPVATPGPVTLPAGTLPAAVPAAPQLPSGIPGQVRPANELVTTSGVIYKNVEVQKVMADAIVISYTPAHGDWAMTKVYFRDLPAGIRQQYEK
ncbi:MAG TPA: hypothetical protein VKS19_05325 [Verrucomicrobiae bacterium]|nr:hypothetical protein [Verrucomicrobiae bacterium]